MKFIYNIGIYLLRVVLTILSLFNTKIKLGLKGRAQTFNVLRNSITKDDKSIWIHCASLGEFEQGLPVLKALKESYSNYKFIVSFFSPSGYEIKKQSKDIDVAVYLPLDTLNNAKKFLDIFSPKLILFVKYEVWPNLLFEAKKRKIPSLLISATLRKSQIYFKWYGSFIRKALFAFDHIFTQDETSKLLLENHGYTTASVSGDTRFDRVNAQLEMDNIVDFIESFVDNKLTIVFGSTWPADDSLLIPFINEYEDDIKFILAPHNINKNYTESLVKQLRQPSICFSDMKDQNLSKYKVFILDTIGYLSKVYTYADIAYVGGGAGNTGLHNILEPAIFSKPIIIGKSYQKFPEAKKMIDLGGVKSVTNAKELCLILKALVTSERTRIDMGHINSEYVLHNTGAVVKIMTHIDKHNYLTKTKTQ